MINGIAFESVIASRLAFSPDNVLNQLYGFLRLLNLLAGLCWCFLLTPLILQCLRIPTMLINNQNNSIKKADKLNLKYKDIKTDKAPIAFSKLNTID